MNPRKNFFRNTPETPGQMGQNLTLGSNPRYLRILASDLELIQTCLEPTPSGPRLVLEKKDGCWRWTGRL